MAVGENQANETKRVAKTTYRLEQEKKKRWQNEGITRHVHENKRHSNLTWIKITVNP